MIQFTFFFNILKDFSIRFVLYKALLEKLYRKKCPCTPVSVLTFCSPGELGYRCKGRGRARFGLLAKSLATTQPRAELQNPYPTLRGRIGEYAP